MYGSVCATITYDWHGLLEHSGRIGAFFEGPDKLRLITRYLRDAKTLIVADFEWNDDDNVYHSINQEPASCLGQNPSKGFMLRQLKRYIADVTV